MENLTKKIEVMNNLLEMCEELKSKAYSITFWNSELKIQGYYSNRIVTELSEAYGFKFNIKESGFIEAERDFYDFVVNIVLT